MHITPLNDETLKAMEHLKDAEGENEGLHAAKDMCSDVNICGNDGGEKGSVPRSGVNRVLCSTTKKDVTGPMDVENTRLCLEGAGRACAWNITINRSLFMVQ